MEDNNDILIEDGIMKSIRFNGGIYVANSVLVDVEALFVKISLNKINFNIKTGERETHEVCWREDFVQVTKSSNISDPEFVHQTKP